MTLPRETVIAALESKLEQDENGCWCHQGPKTGTGHTTVYVEGATHGTASRLAYQVWVGPIPPNKYVLHSCKNKACINPEHLYLGSFQDIIKKRDAEGRSIRGGRNPKAKLSAEQAAEIKLRIKTEPAKKLAKEYKVSLPTISHIKNGVTWR